MKRFLFLLALSFGFNKVYAQFDFGIKDSLFSQTLNENRNLLIYLPKSLRDKKDTSKRYPVLYVLDGDSHFLSVSGIVQNLSEKVGNKVLPEMIIVCIPNTNRTRDLTPYKVGADAHLNDSMARETGGGDYFTKFFKEELFSHINKLFPTTNSRTIVGHSFGGLFVLNLLANHKDLFDNYIVIDPSLWYDHQKFGISVLTQVQKNEYKGKNLFLTIANTTGIIDTAQVSKSTKPFTDHEQSILSFSYALRDQRHPSLSFVYKYYPNDDHGSVPLVSIYDALRYIFKNSRLPKPTKK